LEVLIPLGWALAMHLLQRGKWCWSGGVFGVAMWIAPWAVLALPALLAVGRPARAARTAALAFLVGASAYVPFVLTGQFHMFAHRWPVESGTLVHLLDPGMTSATWFIRLVQAVVVAGGTAVIALRTRATPYATVAAPLAAILLRIGTDPLRMDYYWAPAAAASLGLLIVALRYRPPLHRWSACALAYATVLASAAGATVIGAAVGVLLLAMIVGTARSKSSPAAALPRPYTLELENRVQ
jgi:hypothetical protein